MSHYVAGEPIVDYLTHVGNDGQPITGATFTVVTTRKPDGSSFVPTITGLGGGSYQITIPTARTEAGQWYLLVADQSLTPPRYYDNSWDVDPAAPEPNLVTTGPSTRGQLRRSIGRLLGDVIVCTATQTSGAPETFFDDLNLVYQDNILAGRRAFVSSAIDPANVGLSRRVSGNTKSTASITFAPGLATAAAIGDVVELYNERDLGPSVEDIHQVINSVILSAQDVAVTEAVQQLASPFSWDQPVLAIPATWSFFSSVEWKDRRGVWHPVPPADLRIDIPGRTVELRNRSTYLAEGMTIRLRGQLAAAPLVTDADATPVDAEWLKYQAAAELLISMSHRAHDSAMSERKAQYFQSLADSRRAKTRRRIGGRAVRLQ